jgi:hypothetical protein
VAELEFKDRALVGLHKDGVFHCRSGVVLLQGCNAIGFLLVKDGGFVDFGDAGRLSPIIV